MFVKNSHLKTYASSKNRIDRNVIQFNWTKQHTSLKTKANFRSKMTRGVSALDMFVSLPADSGVSDGCNNRHPGDGQRDALLRIYLSLRVKLHKYIT